MTDDDLVQEFWGHTTQGAKLCTWADLLGLVQRARAAEGEACARVAEDYCDDYGVRVNEAIREIAKRIRKRGQEC